MYLNFLKLIFNIFFLFLELSTEYKNNNELKVWLNYFKVLAFVPLVDIGRAWSIVVQNKPSIAGCQEEIKHFIDYFYRQWLNNSNIPINLWNHFDNYGPRTNNHVEGYNRKLGTNIVNDHPNVYSLINTLKVLELSWTRFKIKQTIE